MWFVRLASFHLHHMIILPGVLCPLPPSSPSESPLADAISMSSEEILDSFSDIFSSFRCSSPSSASPLGGSASSSIVSIIGWYEKNEKGMGRSFLWNTELTFVVHDLFGAEVGVDDPLDFRLHERPDLRVHHLVHDALDAGVHIGRAASMNED